MTADLRFGMNLTRLEDRTSWVEKCQRAEDLGYHVITVPDHIDMPSPFPACALVPACVLAAEAAKSVRAGTFVSNTSFYNPLLFARDVMSARRPSPVARRPLRRPPEHHPPQPASPAATTQHPPNPGQNRPQPSRGTGFTLSSSKSRTTHYVSADDSRHHGPPAPPHNFRILTQQPD